MKDCSGILHVKEYDKDLTESSRSGRQLKIISKLENHILMIGNETQFSTKTTLSFLLQIFVYLRQKTRREKGTEIVPFCYFKIWRNMIL